MSSKPIFTKLSLVYLRLAILSGFGWCCASGLVETYCGRFAWTFEQHNSNDEPKTSRDMTVVPLAVARFIPARKIHTFVSAVNLCNHASSIFSARIRTPSFGETVSRTQPLREDSPAANPCAVR